MIIWCTWERGNWCVANRGAEAMFSWRGHDLFLPGVRHVPLPYTLPIHYIYTLYILQIYCSGNCQYSFAFISFYTFYTPSKYSLHIVVHSFPLYSSAVHYVTHRVPQCNDHLHRFHCLPRTYIHMCDFPMIIISLKFQVRCETGFICFPWFRVFEGC